MNLPRPICFSLDENITHWNVLIVTTAAGFSHVTNISKAWSSQNSTSHEQVFATFRTQVGLKEMFQTESPMICILPGVPGVWDIPSNHSSLSIYLFTHTHTHTYPSFYFLNLTQNMWFYHLNPMGICAIKMFYYILISFFELHCFMLPVSSFIWVSNFDGINHYFNMVYRILETYCHGSQ